MKNFNGLWKYVLIFIVFLFLFLYLKEYKVRVEAENLNNTYKKEILEKDSLREVGIGHYQKLVDDMNTKNDLYQLLERENNELLIKIKEKDKKIFSYSKMNFKPTTKTDTIILHNTKDLVVTDYYPDKENVFITYFGRLEENKWISSFEFKDLDLSLVVTERSKGIYEADFVAPSWLKLNKLKINSLPLSNRKEKSFGWYAGVNLGYNFFDKYPISGIEYGFRLRKSLYGVEVNTNKELKVGYKIMF